MNNQIEMNNPMMNYSMSSIFLNCCDTNAVVVAFVSNISLSQSFCICSKTSPMQMASSSYHPNIYDNNEFNLFLQSYLLHAVIGQNQ
jgi:hypothetical protein